jgi:hypothetical protein
VRVGDRDAGHAEARGELGRPAVAVADHQPRVPGLDPVDGSGEPLEGARLAPAQRAAKPVERVGDADQAALVAHGRDRLGRGEAGRNRLMEEDADEVARLRANLLPDDDRHAGRLVRGSVTGFDRAVDPVVVGDRQVRQASSRGGAEDRGGRRERVEARRGVAVQVEEGARQCPGRESSGRGPRRSFTSALGGF